MTALAKRLLQWCERHYVRQGSPFSIEGREWVWEHLFLPTFGWKLWPRNPAKLCDDCRERIGEWVDWSPTLIRSLKGHWQRKDGCEGLQLYPNMVTLLNLDRGAGKTTNLFGLTEAALDEPELAPFSAQFMAAAGEQSKTLVQEYLLEPLNAERRLQKRFVHRSNKVTVRHKGRGESFVEVVDTSHRSNTGRRRDLILIDEARDVPGRAFSSMLPSLKSKSKLICPRGHTERPYEDEKILSCSVCGETLVPRIPRVLIVSTSGLDEGNGEFAWFNELVEKLQAEPSRYAHVFRSEEAGNPNISRHETDMLHEVFGDVPALRDYMAVELGNAPVRKGDAFVTRSDLRRVSDPSVENLDGSLLECVGFLDTSWSSDLTSLLICGWDPDLCERAWSQLRVLHWKIWAPKEQAHGIIDPSAIQAHLDHHIPLFPSLRMLMVDDRGMEWAKRLVVYNNRERGRSWGRKVKAFHGKRVRGPGGRVRSEGARVPGLFGGQDDRDRGWQLLEQRIAMGPDSLALPPEEKLPELHAELLGVVRKLTSYGGYQITDRNRKKRHADVADGLAGCCLLAYLCQTNQRWTLMEMAGNSREDTLAELSQPVMGRVRETGFF